MRSPASLVGRLSSVTRHQLSLMMGYANGGAEKLRTPFLLVHGERVHTRVSYYANKRSSPCLFCLLVLRVRARTSELFSPLCHVQDLLFSIDASKELLGRTKG